MLVATSGNQHVVEFLATFEIDLFDAIACNNLDRIAAILDKDPSRLEITLQDVLVAADEPREVGWITPLASAVERKQPGAVRLLLERGANANLKDTQGKRLLDIAKKESTAEIVNRLEIHQRT